MATSTQVTNLINQQANPEEAEYKVWKKTRYLVAQRPAADDYKETKQGYYNGKVVIPGPLYNPKLSEGLEFGHASLRDFQIMKSRHFIRFVDNRTTDDADETIGKALYTPMDKHEADDYESQLKKLKDG